MGSGTGGKIKNYKELGVWQKVIDLVTEIYELSKIFPQPEKYGLAAQIQRAAISVPANIAEGWSSGFDQRIYPVFKNISGIAGRTGDPPHYCSKIKLYFNTNIR